MGNRRAAVAVAIAVAIVAIGFVIRARPADSDEDVVTPEARADALARAQVWRAPAMPIRHVRFGRDPTTPNALDCQFKPTDIGGTTPKFHCVLGSGTEIRAKYGYGDEIPSEAAATRLLTALGFGADTVTLVERVRCYGCPKEPFLTMKVVTASRTRRLYERVVNHDAFEEFHWVAVEQKFDAPEIETKDQRGWAFHELDNVDAKQGGAPREQLDALRLMAVFLAHWDNKSENQRLVCQSRGWREGARCPEPFLLLQDVGSTFGPTRVDLRAWEQATIWDDRGTCTISMRNMPFKGGTFGSARITERGRRFLLALLGELSEQQLADLFSSARFDQQSGLVSAATPVSEWVRVFKQRVKTIGDGPPCPDA
jgi:hypothetical protein